MDENLIDALRRVQDKFAPEISRAEAKTLLHAGLAQRLDGLLRLTAKGKAVLVSLIQADG